MHVFSSAKGTVAGILGAPLVTRRTRLFKDLWRGQGPLIVHRRSYVMSSLQSITASSSFGSLRQKLTPEYLAQQLPVFQERVPRAAQVRPWMLGLRKVVWEIVLGVVWCSETALWIVGSICANIPVRELSLHQSVIHCMYMTTVTYRDARVDTMWRFQCSRRCHFMIPSGFRLIPKGCGNRHTESIGLI